MIIDIEVSWTFATPPTTTPYSVDIYYRKVGTTTYETQTIITGESGSATINIVNSTEDTISDRSEPCSWEYEGYVVPTCAANAVDQRFPFTTDAPLDLTDYMQCRGIQAECTAGGIIAIIPDRTVEFGVGPGIPLPSIDLSSFTGSGNSALLPGIQVTFINPSGPLSGIDYILLTGVDFSAGFDSTTSFDIIGEDDKTLPVTMTPTIVTACGSLDPINNMCYSGTPTYIPFATTNNGIINTCTNNETVDDYNNIFDNIANDSIGTVTVTEDYTCCQSTECKVYYIQNIGVASMPYITSVNLGYISAVTGEVTYTPNINLGYSQAVFAIEGTIRPYSTDVSALPSPAGENILYSMAAYYILGGIVITEAGSCGS
jgi:hypothetical protein